MSILAHILATAGERVQALSREAEKQQWETRRFTLALLMEFLPMTLRNHTEFQTQLATILASSDKPTFAVVRR